MQHATKAYSFLVFALLAIATTGILMIQNYTSAASVWNRQEKIYQERLSTLSGSIQALRAERTEAERLYREKDTALSGSINTAKDEYGRIEICLQSRSIDCENADKQAMFSLIPATYAQSNSWTDSLAPASEVPKRTSESLCAIGTWSHDVRSLAVNYPWVAGWKNNNPSGITLGSKALEKSFDEAGILWYVWTARPAKEWSNYYGFPDLENGMRAKLLIIKRSYKNHSIASYLRVWGTDGINTHIDTKRAIASLSDDELLTLIRSQIRKESGALSDYIFDHVIRCN